MNSGQFAYSDGSAIHEGDSISVSGKRGWVERIFAARTPAAKDFSCFDTGGVLLRFESGDLQVWPYINEDLVFLDRGCSGQAPSQGEENPNGRR